MHGHLLTEKNYARLSAPLEKEISIAAKQGYPKIKKRS